MQRTLFFAQVKARFGYWSHWIYDSQFTVQKARPEIISQHVKYIFMTKYGHCIGAMSYVKGNGWLIF